jgi:hypothetical protein
MWEMDFIRHRIANCPYAACIWCRNTAQYEEDGWDQAGRARGSSVARLSTEDGGN